MDNLKRWSSPVCFSRNHARLPTCLTMAIALLCASKLCAAQIITHQGALPAQQANVITPDRGAPIVQIARPNQQGVSHNQFQQFSVGREGAILSNNTAQATTQLHISDTDVNNSDNTPQDMPRPPTEDTPSVLSDASVDSTILAPHSSTTNSTFVLSEHNVQHDYRYWDANNFREVFNRSPTIKAYLNHFGAARPTSAARVREILRLMNIAHTSVHDARRLLNHPNWPGRFVALVSYHGQVLETVFDNRQQRITDLRLLPSRQAASASTPPNTNDEL